MFSIRIILFMIVVPVFYYFLFWTNMGNMQLLRILSNMIWRMI